MATITKEEALQLAMDGLSKEQLSQHNIVDSIPQTEFTAPKDVAFEQPPAEKQAMLEQQNVIQPPDQQGFQAFTPEYMQQRDQEFAGQPKVAERDLQQEPYTPEEIQSNTIKQNKFDDNLEMKGLQGITDAIGKDPSGRFAHAVANTLTFGAVTGAEELVGLNYPDKEDWGDESGKIQALADISGIVAGIAIPIAVGSPTAATLPEREAAKIGKTWLQHVSTIGKATGKAGAKGSAYGFLWNDKGDLKNLKEAGFSKEAWMDLAKKKGVMALVSGVVSSSAGGLTAAAQAGADVIANHPQMVKKVIKYATKIKAVKQSEFGKRLMELDKRLSKNPKLINVKNTVNDIKQIVKQNPEIKPILKENPTLRKFVELEEKNRSFQNKGQDFFKAMTDSTKNMNKQVKLQQMQLAGQKVLLKKAPKGSAEAAQISEKIKAITGNINTIKNDQALAMKKASEQYSQYVDAGGNLIKPESIPDKEFDISYKEMQTMFNDMKNAFKTYSKANNAKPSAQIKIEKTLNSLKNKAKISSKTYRKAVSEYDKFVDDMDVVDELMMKGTDYNRLKTEVAIKKGFVESETARSAVKNIFPKHLIGQMKSSRQFVGMLRGFVPLLERITRGLMVYGTIGKALGVVGANDRLAGDQ